MKADLVGSFKAELDRCGIGSDTFFDTEMIVYKMDIMEKSIDQKFEARVDKFAADDGAVVNTSTDVDAQHVNNEFTQVRVKQVSHLFTISSFAWAGQLKRSQKILSSPQ